MNEDLKLVLVCFGCVALTAAVAWLLRLVISLADENHIEEHSKGHGD